MKTMFKIVIVINLCLLAWWEVQYLVTASNPCSSFSDTPCDEISMDMARRNGDKS